MTQSRIAHAVCQPSHTLNCRGHVAVFSGASALAAFLPFLSAPAAEPFGLRSRSIHLYLQSERFGPWDVFRSVDPRTRDRRGSVNHRRRRTIAVASGLEKTTAMAGRAWCAAQAWRRSPSESS